MIFWGLFWSQICDIFSQYVTYVWPLQLTTFVTSFDIKVKILLWEFTPERQYVTSFAICDIWGNFCQFVTYVGTISYICHICDNYFIAYAELLFLWSAAVFITFVTYVIHLPHLFIRISIDIICDICGNYLWHMWLIFPKLWHMWDLGINHICHIFWALVTSYLPHLLTFCSVRICDICVTCGKCGNLVLKRFHQFIYHICHIFFNLSHLSICHIYLWHIIYHICHIFSRCDN